MVSPLNHLGEEEENVSLIHLEGTTPLVHIAGTPTVLGVQQVARLFIQVNLVPEEILGAGTQLLLVKIVELETVKARIFAGNVDLT